MSVIRLICLTLVLGVPIPFFDLLLCMIGGYLSNPGGTLFLMILGPVFYGLLLWPFFRRRMSRGYFVVIVCIFTILAPSTFPCFMRPYKRHADTRMLQDLQMIDAAAFQYSLTNPEGESSGTSPRKFPPHP